ncbi:MAG: asparagine--tRNA ligase [Planctomycetaceae bacterium]|jgi:asparaginyl-tRNA synthetase|nr:asparagine--tRNA ligase [Planctomycetaceae bacterium]
MIVYEKLTVAEARKGDAVGKNVLLEGWVRTRRDSKAGFSFVELNDGSSFGNIQILIAKELPNYETTVKSITAGSSLVVRGIVKTSPGQGQVTEIEAKEIELIGTADPTTYPLQKKGHSLEFLRSIAHLRVRTNTFGAIARIRNRVSFSIHQFFQENGFFYVHTPIITASDCEGAGQMFRVSSLDLDDLPKNDNGKVDFSKDFFGQPSYLTVSGQLNVETYCAGLSKVYTFGPTFRAENSNTSRHAAEFWMIEPEIAFCELEGNMEWAEKFLKRLIADVLQHSAEDIAFFNEHIDKTLIETLQHVLSSQFIRLSYTEAIDLLVQSGRKFDYKVEWGIDLQSEHERYLTEEHFKSPVILYDYPKTIKPFYMRVNDDGKTVRAMDVLVPKVGEIIGGSEREYRLEILETRMKDQKLDLEAYRWYADLRRYGTVPHCGFGLGLERALMFLTGIANIRDVLPFPRTPGNCEF